MQNLLDLSRIESGAYPVSIEKTDLLKVLGETIESQKRAALVRGLSLNFNSPENDSIFAATSAAALRRITSSLIENAMKYTPEGGTISVSIRREKHRAAITVEDDGCGIRAEDLPRVFERFYRGRPLEMAGDNKAGGGGEEQGEEEKEAECVFSVEAPGVGLGLYLVENLVGRIGAEIQVESPAQEDNGRGTRFTLFLTLSAAD